MDPPTSSGRDDLEMEMQPIVPRGPIDPDGRKITRSNDGNMKMPSRSNRGRNLPRPMATAVAHGQSIMAMVDSDAKKKKMLLVFLCILMAALVGMVAVKGDAVDIEKVVEEGEIEVAHHDDTATGDAESKSSSSSSSAAAVHTVDLDGYLPKSMVNASDYVLPGTENAPPLSAAKGRPYYPIINHFQNRNPTGSYAKKWGYFDLEDPDPKWKGKMRPQPDFGAVPNRDVKLTDFPDGAWQKDKEYMTRFLEEAKKLVNRTIEAVYGEWGVGIPQDGSVELTDEFMVNREAFYKWPKPSDQSLDGMTRRFIHHIMTGDSFKLVLGGHSAAAGHGAGFNASYVHQAGLVLEPVFAHLGVEFRSYNFAQGGMGTFQQALAGMDLRGKDADMLIWDSSMTEKSPPLTNFFFRQGLLAGNRAPFLYSGGGANPAAFEAIGASVGGYGELGYSPITTSEEQAKTLPWAARYNKCESGASALCTAQEYDGKCWVEREDFTPEAKQQELVGGQAKWHPGPKKHRTRGRALALSVLFMLQHALDKWEELGTESGYPVAEQYWHVTDFYNSIKEKVPTVEGCYSDDAWKIGQSRRGLRENNQIYGRRLDLEGFWPSRLCNIPMHGRSLWGPRVNPMESSLLSILKPNAYGDVDPNIHDNPDYMKGPDYFPPDRAAPWSTPPEPEVNPWEIAGSRRLQDKAHASNGEQANSGNFLSDTEKEALPSAEEVAKARGTVNATALRILAEDPDAIVPGLGLEVLWGLPGVCDGTTHGWCDKSTTTDCLYSGAQDNRGMICFNPLSGWVVFDVKEVKHGFIGARMESWHKSGDLTKGWNEVNNGGKGNYAKEGLERHLLQKEKQERDAMYLEEMSHRIEEDMLLEDPSTARRLGGGQSCGASGDYIFEFAINGKIVASWDKDAFCSHYTRTGYNLDLIKFMDDEKMTGDFELAMRMSPTHSNKQGT
eukprot:scaffold27156_cov148-Skeletonema_menzelii.AAC.1